MKRGVERLYLTEKKALYFEAFLIVENEKRTVHRSLEKLSLNLHSEQLYHSSMSEKQNIEWKESWRDEYLKWICGFANAVGGKLYIGMDVRQSRWS